MDSRDFERLKEAVHLVCWEAREMTLGSIRLSKIIFCADRATYLSKLEPMIADEYVRGKQGPYLKKLKVAIEELSQEGSLSVKTIRIKDRSFKDYTATREPQIQLLTNEEQSLLMDLTYSICTDYSAEAISEATHNVAWKIASDGEIIPLHAQLVSTYVKATKQQIAWALEESLESSNV